MRQKDVAKMLGKSPQQVNEFLSFFKPVIDYYASVQAYRDTKQDLFDAAEALALKSLIDCLARDEGNLQQRAVAFREIFSANRLTHNQSTSNKAVISFTDVPQQLQDLISLPTTSKTPDK